MGDLDQRLARWVDIPIELSVELDRKHLKAREVLALEIGSVVRMNRSAGDNMSLLLHGQLVGYGEIVVIEDTMGLRITEIAGRKRE